MPFGKSKQFSHRKQVSSRSVVDDDVEDLPAAPDAAESPQRSRRMPACERYALFARLAWLPNYAYIFAAERAAGAATGSQDSSVSAYTRRAIERDLAGRQAQALLARSGDTDGFLRRSANVHFVPFSQAVKSISFLPLRRCLQST